MIAKQPRRLLLLQLLIAGALLLGCPGLGLAQFDEDFGEDEFFGADDQFLESDEDLFGTPEDDFTEGGQFVDESLLPPAGGVTAGSRQSQLRALSERDQLPMNAAWGAGTGLLIGGWFALINNGTNRETQRSLGLGIVIGTIIGVTVGVKSLIVPNAPIPVSRAVPFEDRGSFAAMAAVPRSPFQFTYAIRF